MKKKNLPSEMETPSLECLVVKMQGMQRVRYLGLKTATKLLEEES